MKKIIALVFVLILGIFGFVYYNQMKDRVKPLDIEEEKVEVDKYYIYGTTLNLHGTIKLKNYQEIKLTLYNGEFKDYDVIYNDEDNSIILSEEINDGLYLDNIEIGNYPMFLKVKYKNLDDKIKDEYIYKYYVLDNKTEYNDIKYYTISNYNKEILINSDNNYNTMMLNITTSKNDKVYDIVIDPGHGGMDSGACSGNDCESDYTLMIAEKLKTKLEDAGLKVKLTREKDSLTKNEMLEEYGQGGRAVISHEVYAKYTFSIHINSNSAGYVRGLEIYLPANINYDFASNIVENILNNTGSTISSNKINRVKEALYSKNFTASDIENDKNKKISKGYKPYDITENSNYFYMIRETGGIVTGAYVDDRNPDLGPSNPYYNSNVGSETYLIEYGYITNEEDLNIIINEQDKYTEAIANAIKSELNIK